MTKLWCWFFKQLSQNIYLFILRKKMTIFLRLSGSDCSKKSDKLLNHREREKEKKKKRPHGKIYIFHIKAFTHQKSLILKVYEYQWL